MEVETDAEYFDYLAGLSDSHLHRVLFVRNLLLHKPNSWENPRRGNSPFLVVLRGFQRGKSKSPFGVFFLPPAAFSLPRKEKGAESCLVPFGREKNSAPTARSGGQGRPPLQSTPHAARADKVSPFGWQTCVLRTQFSPRLRRGIMPSGHKKPPASSGCGPPVPAAQSECHPAGVTDHAAFAA